MVSIKGPLYIFFRYGFNRFIKETIYLGQGHLTMLK